jgi:hypothetical protein
VALITPGPIVTAITGSIGGVTFGLAGPGGPYARARVTPTDPSTLEQSYVRGLLGAAASRWSTVLTPAQRSAWNTYAAGTPLPGRLGTPRPVSGIAMYCRTQALYYRATALFLDVAPVSLGEAGHLFNTGTATLDASALTLTFSAAALQPMEALAAEHVLAYGAAVPRPPGQPGIPPRTYTYLGQSDGLSLDAADWDIAIPFGLTSGLTYLFRLRYLDKEGRIAPATELGIIATA